MKYNIKKLESSKELEEIELVFYEDKNTDNCYYLIQGDDLNIGISYYNLGIKPCIKVFDKIIILGYGISIIIYNFSDEKVLYYDVDALHMIFDICFIEKLNYVIVICELKLLSFDLNGNCVWECGFLDLINDWSFEENDIVLKFDGKRDLIVSMFTGEVKL